MSEDPPPDEAQAFVAGRDSPHLTVPRVRPAMSTLGFGAAGRAGNASPPAFEAREDDAIGVEEPLGRGEERVDVLRAGKEDGEGAAAVPHAVVALLRAAGREEDEDAEERGGNAVADEAEEGSAPLRPTADREDCAVDDFKRSTRFPPAPLPLTVSGDMPGSNPPGPGRAG